MLNAALIDCPPDPLVYAVQKAWLPAFMSGAIPTGVGVVSYSCTCGATHHAVALTFHPDWTWIGAPVVECATMEIAKELFQSKSEVRH